LIETPCGWRLAAGYFSGRKHMSSKVKQDSNYIAHALRLLSVRASLKFD